MPGFLGGQNSFKRGIVKQIKDGDEETLDYLRGRVRPFILRRTKSEVAKDLPPKVENVYYCNLLDEQLELYAALAKKLKEQVLATVDEKGMAKSQMSILDALLKLRQVCCDPRLVKTLPATAKAPASAKLGLLMELLPELLAEGRRVLLFSQFTSMLTLIEAELQAAGLAWTKLTGQTQKRDEAIARFTSGEVPLFLISLKAGGTGLNLTAADTVIHYDPWWNPAVEHQATDRAHRIGQQNPVFVYKLIAAGTIEERILTLQSRKAELAEAVLTGSLSGAGAALTQEDLLSLLEGL